MKILIDADGCPVVDICIKSAKRHGIECLILCDTSHIFEREGAKTVTVSKGADSVDFKIVNLLDLGAGHGQTGVILLGGDAGNIGIIRKPAHR